MKPSETKADHLSPNPPKTGKLQTFAGAAGNFVAGVLVLTAWALVGFSVCLGHGMLRSGGLSLVELLGGAAIGAISAFMRITGYRYSLGLGAGGLLGWIICFATKLFTLAPLAAIPGGYFGGWMHRKLKANPPEQSPPELPSAQRPARRLSVAAQVRIIVALILGIALGWILGVVVGGWLCMVLMFDAYLPSQVPRTVEYGPWLVIYIFGLAGGVIGAGIGGRLLHLLTVKREAARPTREDVIREYEEWKRNHPPAIEMENEDTKDQ